MQVCPNCGYCPCCGRPQQLQPWPYYPQPIWYATPNTGTNTIPGNNTITITSQGGFSNG